MVFFLGVSDTLSLSTRHQIGLTQETSHVPDVVGARGGIAGIAVGFGRVEGDGTEHIFTAIFGQMDGVGG